jgi:Asp-tRNA(Asn)/Glu-tRNA(Gln) amidotransferase A subunit family amidase
MSIPVRDRIAIALTCASLTVGAGDVHAQQARPFHLQEATVASIHDAFAAQQLTCAQLTKLYLNRIEAYNLRGPTLHAIITVNPKAMERAAELDRQYTGNPSGAGRLHCIPVILKDNFNTADMSTSGGNVEMEKSVPPADAFVVDKIRKAGALILAKANMQEFARGGM